MGKLKKTEDSKRFDVDRLRHLEIGNKFKVELDGKFDPLLRLEEMSVEAMWQGFSESLKSAEEEVTEYRKNMKKVWLDPPVYQLADRKAEIKK